MVESYTCYNDFSEKFLHVKNLDIPKMLKISRKKLYFVFTAYTGGTESRLV